MSDYFEFSKGNKRKEVVGRNANFVFLVWKNSGFADCEDAFSMNFQSDHRSASRKIGKRKTTNNKFYSRNRKCRKILLILPH